jgi:hypothetical protein
MPNIFVHPNSGILEFNTGIAGGAIFAPLSGAARFSFQNSGEINLTSFSTTTPNRFSIDGNQGRLFSVTDSLTGSIFSVNDVAGLPLIEVSSATDDVITLGAYDTNTFVVKNDKIGIGINSPNEKLDIIGNVKISGNVAPSQGVVLVAPNNTKYLLTVNNDGSLETTLI